MTTDHSKHHTDPGAAYAAAHQRITEAQAACARDLVLACENLTRLPPELGRLRRLRSLRLSCPKITDLAPLAPLTGLRLLSLRAMWQVDFSGLAPLIGLRCLYLSYTNIADLAPLGNMRDLAVLTLGRTDVKDLTALAPLSKLELLDLKFTAVTDLWPLLDIKGLKSLRVENTPVMDLRPIAYLDEIWDHSGHPMPEVCGAGTGYLADFYLHGCAAYMANDVIRWLAGWQRPDMMRDYLLNILDWDAFLADRS